jgi:AraC family transcriptional activator of pyochelin receptor
MAPDQHPAANAAVMEAIEVSPEMTALLGRGEIAEPPMPANPVALIYAFAADETPPTLRFAPEVRLDELSGGCDHAYRLIFLVDRTAMQRLGGGALAGELPLLAYLPSELRAIAMALREPPATPLARTTYLLAKSIELLCETIRMNSADALVPMIHDGVLSLADTRRLIAARKVIDERWSEKLTLDGIARACGLNRAKLTRGFREVFACTVAEALAERRLSQARQLLLTTDLPISSVGYEAGYLSNASFARAFGRHFGRSPSDYRAFGLAA